MFNMKAKPLRNWLHGLMFLIIWPSVKEKKKKVKKIQIYILYKQYATQQLIEIHKRK